VVDLHVEVDPKITVHEGHYIAHAVKGALMTEIPGVTEVLVHIEPFE
jgi:divalent metal cation (Fe/Co/Zn/Cd) transporter